ncbi:uncharacterized protein ACIQIH_010276 isoform 2-T2 [Cyanocitta cristata]
MHKGGRTILRSLRRCLFSGPLTADTDTSYKEMEMKETVFELNIWSQPLSVTDSLKCFPYCWITEGQKTEIYEKIKEDATWAGVLYRLINDASPLRGKDFGNFGAAVAGAAILHSEGS